MTDKRDKALKLALEWHEWINSGKSVGYAPCSSNDVLKALKEAQEQQQKPYGWKVVGVNALYRGEFAEHDAKAEAKRIGGTCTAFPLYKSSPASKPWVSLTDEERKWLRKRNQKHDDYAKAVDALLKEKNCGHC